MSNAQFWKVILNVVFCRVYTVKIQKMLFRFFIYNFSENIPHFAESP
jgi:hypothetical protein